MHSQRHNNKSQGDGSGDDIPQHFETFHPDRIIPSHSVERTPESVRQMEP